jgi:hypothetical protein
MILIEVLVEQAHVHAVESALLSYCAETGDVVLSRHYDEEFDQWLFVIHLREQGSRAKHVQTVSEALKQQAIVSVAFVQGNLLRLSSPDIGETMRSFPLAFGDAWIPDWQGEHTVFLCYHRPLVTRQQAAWLMMHEEVEWHYL